MDGGCRLNNQPVEPWRYWRVCKSCQESPVSAPIVRSQQVTQLSITIPSDLSRYVELVSAFYVASLGDLAGEGYHSPSLPFLSTAWVCYPGAHLVFPMVLEPHSRW